ncbi:MAG: Gfo/Idh/MocA family oxidoreductase [Propionibacteriaceae bacterium]
MRRRLNRSLRCIGSAPGSPAGCCLRHRYGTADDRRGGLSRPRIWRSRNPAGKGAAVAVDSLERGVRVIWEKPLAHTLADGQRLLEVAERG